MCPVIVLEIFHDVWHGYPLTLPTCLKMRQPLSQAWHTESTLIQIKPFLNFLEFEVRLFNIQESRLGAALLRQLWQV